MKFRIIPTVSMLGLLVLTAVQSVDASGYLTKYDTASNTPGIVYKALDSAGKVTYSTHRPRDSVTIEEIAIIPGPVDEYVEDSRERLDRISETLKELTAAREQRQAQREEETKKRLERLALQRSTQPQVYERKVYVGWNPLWWPRFPVAHHANYPHKPVFNPLHRPGLYSDRPVGRAINPR